MKRYLTALFFIAAAALSAQLSSYLYYRELKPVTKNGFYEMRIGSAVLDRDGAYRVYEVGAKDTVEVPYVKEDQLFHSYDRRFFKQMKVIDESFEKDKFSYATLVLDTDLVYNTVYLDIPDHDFFKDVTVEGSSDNKSWKTVVENEKLFNYYKGADEHYYRSHVRFRDISFRYLRLKFDDSRSLKVMLAGAYIPVDKQYTVTSGELVSSALSRREYEKNRQTIIECTLPRKYSITTLNFQVKHSQPHYRRGYTISLKDNSAAKENWVYFGEGVLDSERENSAILNTYSNDAAFKSDMVRITINNLDDTPLENVAVDVYTREEKIKLKLEAGKKYLLAYGKSTDHSPQYDIENFRNSIPLVLPLIEAGIEVAIPQAAEVKQQPLIGSDKWIWVALIACIAIIGLFTMRLLKQDPNSQKE